MYCFLPFGFINVVIFVINPSGFYLTFIGADLEYHNLLRFDRGSWSELRYFNFESTFEIISSWIVNILFKIFSRIKLTYLFTNRYLSLARLVLIQLLLMLRPSWNKVDKAVSTLSQRRTLTLYRSCATLKIQYRILFHFQRRINVDPMLKCWLGLLFSFKWNLNV